MLLGAQLVGAMFLMLLALERPSPAQRGLHPSELSLYGLLLLRKQGGVADEGQATRKAGRAATRKAGRLLSPRPGRSPLWRWRGGQALAHQRVPLPPGLPPVLSPVLEEWEEPSGGWGGGGEGVPSDAWEGERPKRWVGSRGGGEGESESVVGARPAAATTCTHLLQTKEGAL